MKNNKKETNFVKIIVNCFLVFAAICFAVLGAENLKPLFGAGNPVTIECQNYETDCDLVVLQADIHQELVVSTASTIVVVSFAAVVMDIGLLAIYNKR